MRKYSLALGVAALVALGCDSNGPAGGAAADDSLARDLALAQAAQPAFTLAGTGDSRTRVVSALELAPPGREAAVSATPRPRARRSPTRARAAAPRPVPAPAAPVTLAAATDEAVPEPEPAVEVASAETAVADDGSSAEGIIENPRPAPAPAPAPAPGPAIDPEPRDGGWGGVVIRGGRVDGDHCERHRRRGGGGPIDRIGRLGGPMIAINVRVPMGNTTFPRY